MCLICLQNSCTFPSSVRSLRIWVQILRLSRCISHGLSLGTRRISSCSSSCSVQPITPGTVSKISAVELSFTLFRSSSLAAMFNFGSELLVYYGLGSRLRIHLGLAEETVHATARGAKKKESRRRRLNTYGGGSHGRGNRQPNQLLDGHPNSGCIAGRPQAMDGSHLLVVATE